MVITYLVIIVLASQSCQINPPSSSSLFSFWVPLICCSTNKVQEIEHNISSGRESWAVSGGSADTLCLGFLSIFFHFQHCKKKSVKNRKCPGNFHYLFFLFVCFGFMTVSINSKPGKSTYKVQANTCKKINGKMLSYTGYCTFLCFFFFQCSSSFPTCLWLHQCHLCGHW